jgi:predicted transposase YdaD
VHAPELTEVPPDLPPGPHREAVELANEATFTPAELEAYQRVIDEIQQARELADAAEARGREEGKIDGKAEGKAEAILAFLAARGIAVDSETRARIAACTDAGTLDRWIARAATAASAMEVITPVSKST